MSHKYCIAFAQSLKRLRCLAVLCGLWCSHAFAVSVTLSWDADTGSDIAGYNLSYGTQSGVYSQVTNVGNATTASLTQLKAGNTYYCVVTAYDSAGLDSPPSNEVSFQTGPLAVGSTALVMYGAPVVLDVLANDKCPSGTPTVAQVTQPKYGTAVINSDNTVTYTPGSHFTGRDSFNYTLTDGVGGSSTATITITGVGTFYGLMTNAAPNAQNTGSIELQMTYGGAFTGKLTIGTLTAPFTGSFNASGVGTINVLEAAGATLALNLDSATGEITGSFATGSGLPSTISAALSVYSSSVVASQAGTYTVLLPPNPNPPSGVDAPQGTGFCSLVVSTNGTVRLSGKLADGTSLNASSLLAANGSCAVYAPLYAGKGFLAGMLNFQSITTPGVQSDLNGALEWQKPPGATDFPAGFDTTMDTVGSTYVAPAKGETVAGLLTANGTQATVTLSGGNFTAPDVDEVTLVSANDFKEGGSTGDRVAIQFNASTGTFTGSFVDSTTRSTRQLAGAVFQDQAVASGFFCTTTSGGSLLLTSGT